MPRRNPTRVTAGVSAAAVSPEVADKSEAAVVAGTASSASVALALAPSPANVAPSERETEAQSPDQAATQSDEADDGAPDMAEAAPEASTNETETASNDAPETETADATEPDAEPVETAEADTDATEPEPASAEETVDAGAQADTDETDEETATAMSGEAEDESRPSDAKQGDTDGEETPVDTAETAPAETAPAESKDKTKDDETPAEIAAVAPPEAETPEEDTEAKEAEAADPAQAKPNEAAEAVETVTAAIAEVAPEDAAEAVEPEASTAPVAAPSHDASVVLDVSPPPEDLRVAAVTPEESAEAEAADAETAETSDETSDEASNETADETSDAPAETEEAAKVEEEKVEEVVDDEKVADVVEDEKVQDEVVEDETVEAEETKVAALTPPSATESSEPEEEDTSEPAALDTAPSEDEKVDDEKVEAEDAPADAESAETPGEEEAAAEEVAPPPPAHPVVAAIRAKLETPEQYKDAAASDLKALTEFYGERTEPPLWVGDSGFSPKAEAIMAEIRKADDWGLEASSFHLPSTGAAPLSDDAQAEAEIKLSIAILSYARDAQIGRLSPSGVSKLFDQHPSLRDPKKVLTDLAASDAPDRTLLSLHPQHDQFKRLQQALVRARDSAKATGRDPNSDRKVQLIVINMERWRWLPRDLGNYHVWNNVPEFNVRVMKNGEPIYQEKTIVGQYQYATPFFSARMRNIVFHPNWTVPPTIIKEDLAPKLQGPGGGGFFGSSKEAVLRRYGLSANYKGKKINADTVDWNNVNIHAYTFTQDPGPANVLGQFKFNFPNKHAIYMHDTPQRELFAQRTRTLSHGCIRVNQPDRLAALLLSEDKGWSMGQVRSLVNKGPSSSTVIALNRHVPVHLTYFTAIVGESGQVTDFGDIYGIDNRMAAKLFARPANFPVPATPAVAEEGSSSRTQAQTQRRRSGGGFDNFISGLFGN